MSPIVEVTIASDTFGLLASGTCTTLLFTSSQFFDFSPGAGKPFRWAVTV